MDESEHQDDYAGGGGGAAAAAGGSGGSSVPEEMNPADTELSIIQVIGMDKSKRQDEKLKLEDIFWGDVGVIEYCKIPIEMNPADTGVYGRDFMTRLPGQNFISVKPSDSATPIYPNNQNILDLTSENEEEIPEEKAVCKFCFKAFETGNMFKAKCMCPNALTHEECILNWSGAKGNNECDVCEQEVQSFSVDWHLVVSNQLQKPIKRGWISRLTRVCTCCF